ncbi:MAG: undecaprenyldiphospho-muramoylpentapeptide beta-N-acetylglucosaminyltransferase [Pleurocapsa sp.]
MKRILLTGGGSAGHITVNLALIPMLSESGWEIIYIGSIDGIEKELISKVKKVKYYGIATGKLRRYLDWQNFTDLFRVLKGILEAYQIIRQEKPRITFSEGGFVSVPAVLGSRLNGVLVITHESDLTPGLANRINIYSSQKICTTFRETLNHLPQEKGKFIGAIVRPELKQGKPEKGRIFAQLNSMKPVILVVGGSLGSAYINEILRSLLDVLLEKFQIIHICGKGNLKSNLKRKGYKQFVYVDSELPDVMSLADIVISRAGSNFIFEFLALKKPMILIPLSSKSSRGDQIDNAMVFRNRGCAEVILEENLTKDSLLGTIHNVFNNKEKYISNMDKSYEDCSLERLFNLIVSSAK